MPNQSKTKQTKKSQPKIETIDNKSTETPENETEKEKENNENLDTTNNITLDSNNSLPSSPFHVNIEELIKVKHTTF